MAQITGGKTRNVPFYSTNINVVDSDWISTAAHDMCKNIFGVACSLSLVKIMMSRVERRVRDLSRTKST